MPNRLSSCARCRQSFRCGQLVIDADRVVDDRFDVLIYESPSVRVHLHCPEPSAGDTPS